MNATAGILLDDFIVPDRRGCCFIPGTRDHLACFIEQTSGSQSGLEFSHPLIHSGLDTIDVVTLGIRMAFLALCELGFHHMIVAFTHMAAHTGVLNHGIVRAGLAFDTEAAGTEQDIALNAQVCIKARVGGCVLGRIGCVNEISHIAACLVAVGAQVTGATVEGQTAYNLRYGGIRFQSPVVAGLGGVDLMAGAAVLVGRVGITGFDFGEVLPGSDHGAERRAGVTASTGVAGTFFEKCHAGTVQ